MNGIDLNVIKLISQKPGLNTNQIFDILVSNIPDLTVDKVKNSIKRKLAMYYEYRGDKRNGGYYIKN